MKLQECSEVATYLLFREDRQEEFSMRLCGKHLKPEADGLFEEDPAKEYSLAALNHSAGFPCEYQENVPEGTARSQKPPEWFRTEEVEVTCVGATDNDRGENMYVFMLWRAAAGFDNQQDMFTLSFIEDRILMNGVTLDASDEDKELLSRMTDATILGPWGPDLGRAVTVRAQDLPEYDQHDCPKQRFLDDPITRSTGMGGEMLHRIPCPVCDARKED